MRLLRFAALVVFVFITAFQFVNIRYFGGAIFSLPSQDKFPASIHGSTEPVRPFSGTSEEGEIAGVIGNHTFQSQSHDDKETLDSLQGTGTGTGTSSLVEDADMALAMANENTRSVEILDTKSDASVERLINVSNSGAVSITEMMSLLHLSRTSHASLVSGF